MTESDDLWAAIEAAGPPEGYFLGSFARAQMEAFRDAFSFAVPSREAIGSIVAFLGGRRLLEVGAGSGLWSRLLQDAGVDALATDDFSWEGPEPVIRACPNCVGRTGRLQPDCGVCKGTGLERVVPNLMPGWAIPWSKFCDVERIAAGEAIAKYDDRAALLLVWPPFGTPMAADALEAFGGDSVIYVGEGEGGYTGDRRFHELLDEGWELVEPAIALPRWPFTRDSVFLYRRRE